MPLGRTLPVLATALALLVGAVTAPAAVGQLKSGVSITRASSLEAKLLQQINAVRRANGLSPLARSIPLTRAAAYHSHSMASFGFFTHESRNGASFSTRVQRFYPPGARGWFVGENLAVAMGSVSPESIVSSWMASPGHRANLLQAGYRHAGIAVVHHPAAGGVFGGQPTWLVTLDVGSR